MHLGTRRTRIGVAAVVVGVAALAAGCLAGAASTALALLAAGWLFFASVASGALALAASLRLSGARWATVPLRVAGAAAGFFVPAYVVLIVLVLTLPVWAPGAAHGWLGWAWLAFRELVATAALFFVGNRTARSPSGGSSALAIGYLLLYAATLSMWAIDLVMGLHPWSPNTVVPPYFFMGAYLAGIAWTSFVIAAHTDTAGPDVRHDMGKLLFAFTVVWAYLLWSAYLPTWYGNQPDETGALSARWHGAGKAAAVGVLLLTFAFPCALLLRRAAKRHPRALALGASSVLLGVFVERLLLLFPVTSVAASLGTFLIGAAVTTGLFGLFLLTFERRLEQA